MRRNPILTATLVLLAFALFPATAQQAMAADCTRASAAGSWAYSFNGSVFNAQANTFVPLATMGKIEFDGHGKVNGSETQASPAGIQPVTYTGTYTENPDCSSTITLTTSSKQALTVSFEPANDDNEGYLIITSPSPGFVMTGTTKRVKYHGN
jgi:hypothetical protein